MTLQGGAKYTGLSNLLTEFTKNWIK